MSDSSTPTTSEIKTGATKVKVAPIPAERYSNGRANGKASDSTIPPKKPVFETSPLGGYIPNVMADEPRIEVESVEQKVNRLRPKSIRMQLRFLYAIVFALLLFGRLILWQVYVAKVFPDWVNANNIKRWRKYAREFSNFALRMGGVWIKAGQFASTRADVLPEAVIEELASLQDRVPTLPFRKIKAVLEEELLNYSERFPFIDESPVAAASLGQVHRATLNTGESVVVKVQRPDVRNIVYTDMAALFIVGHVAMRFSFVRRRVDAALIIEEFGRVLLEEISYEQEARNAGRFAAMFAENKGVYIPRIYPDHCTDKVLVMEDVTSIKIDDYERLAAAGIDRKDVAKRLIDTYMQQVFEDRFFHADPHPGNLFIYPLPVEDESIYVGRGGRPYYLIFIDFGMTASLTREIVQGLVNTLAAVITRDSKKLVTSYKELGFLLPNADTRRIEEATNAVFNEVWGMSMSDISTLDFAVVENIGEEFNDLLHEMPFRVPQDFVYFGRTVGILTGMATKLDPSYNPWIEIQKHVQHLITTDAENNIWDEFGKILEQSLNEILSDGPEGFLRVTERLVRQFQRVSKSEQMLQQIINGEIALETKMSAQQRLQLERIEAQSKRTSRMMVVGSLLVCATLFYTSGDTTLALGAAALAAVSYISSWFIRA